MPRRPTSICSRPRRCGRTTGRWCRWLLPTTKTWHAFCPCAARGEEGLGGPRGGLARGRLRGAAAPGHSGAPSASSSRQLLTTSLALTGSQCSRAIGRASNVSADTAVAESRPRRLDDGRYEYSPKKRTASSMRAWGKRTVGETQRDEDAKAPRRSRRRQTRTVPRLHAASTFF